MEINDGEIGGVTIKTANSWRDWLLRIISWIWSPESYTQENRKTIQCFQHYFFRWLFGSRAWEKQGLQVGRYEGTTWTMHTIRPMEVTEALYREMARA